MDYLEHSVTVPSVDRQSPVTYAIWLVSILLILFALGMRMTRFDLRDTRVAISNQSVSARDNWSSGLNLHLGPIINYVINSDNHEYAGSANWSEPSPALVEVTQTLKVGEKNKLIPQKRKVWDLLNELFIVAPDEVIDRAFKALGSSIYLTQNVHRSGLCDYIDRRVMPAITDLIRRRDFGGARQLVLRMTTWINALQSDPQLAHEHPRLQGYVNYFLRLNAVLNDPVTLHSNPTHSKLILNTLLTGTLLEPATATYLRNTGDKELAAWGGYLHGQMLFSNKNVKESEISFSVAAKNTSNAVLLDLLLLGEARSVFWAVKLKQKDTTTAKQTLYKIRAVIRAQYRDDIDYYVAKL